MRHGDGLRYGYQVHETGVLVFGTDHLTEKANMDRTKTTLAVSSVGLGFLSLMTVLCFVMFLVDEHNPLFLLLGFWNLAFAGLIGRFVLKDVRFLRTGSAIRE